MTLAELTYEADAVQEAVELPNQPPGHTTPTVPVENGPL